MAPRPEILVVTANPALAGTFGSELKRLGHAIPLASPRVIRSPNLYDARKRLALAPPALLVLDSDTPPGARAPRDTIDALLAEFGSAVPVLLVFIAQCDASWASKVIRQDRLMIWAWESGVDVLAHVLPLLLQPPAPRRLRATVRLSWPQPECDIDLDGKPLFRGLRLKVGPQFKVNWETVHLRSVVDMSDRQAAYQSLTSMGNALFQATLDELGAALLDADKGGATLDLRFEIPSDSLDRMFPLPIELLNLEASWERFFCRVAPMARRVPPCRIRVHAALPAQSAILYVDASATRGATEIIGQSGEVETRPFPDLTGAVAREQRALEQLGDFCRLELVKPAPGQRLRDALREALARPDCVPEIIHFTGHAITPQFGSTELILPSLERGKVDRVAIGEFAGWLPASVRLVVLSACEGISPDTASKLHADKGIAVLGFRWRVEADAAADFVANFYAALLHDRLPVAAAYRLACYQGNAAQLAWASAVLLDHD